MDATEFGWPPQAVANTALPRVETEIGIACPPERVFDYVTTPALWHTWHPATASVRDVPERPLTTGETMVESIAALGRRFDARWTVLACERPRLWVIATSTGNGDARIVYRIAPSADGCRFHRTLDYRSRRWPYRLLDANVARWLLGRQSARALSNLKQVLERSG
jgi:uncharacterized protein YndB with AHSA1/START domain